jgi:hypothetical protein
MRVRVDEFGGQRDRAFRGGAGSRADGLDAGIGRLVGARDGHQRARLLDALGGGLQVAVGGERLVDEAVEGRVVEERPPALGGRRGRLHDAQVLRQVDLGTLEVRPHGASRNQCQHRREKDPLHRCTP